jgi:hypothetical protein
MRHALIREKNTDNGVGMSNVFQPLMNTGRTSTDAQGRDAGNRGSNANVAGRDSLPDNPVDRCLALLPALEQQLRQHDESRQDL